MAKNGRFRNSRNSRFSKIDFTQNLNDGKILKFPHCEVGNTDLISMQVFFVNTAEIIQNFSSVSLTIYMIEVVLAKLF